MKDFISKTKNNIKNFISFDKINPHEHWKYLVNIFFIVIFILIILSFYLMYQIKNQQIYQAVPASEEKNILINEKVLDKIEQSFKNKLLIQKEIKDGVKSYPDPSL